MEMNMAIRLQSAPRWYEAISREVSTLLGTALPVLRFLLTPVAVLAGVLSVWRLGNDPGWTNGFFIADGFLSHWQVWLVFAAGIQMSALGLNRWVANPERKQGV
jgi:hypothetical protein